MTNNCKKCNISFESIYKTTQFCSKECRSAYRKDPAQVLAWLEKVKKTNLERYGVEDPNKLENIKNKKANTCIDRYGAISPTLNSQVRDKQKETLYKNYGVDYPEQSDVIRDKQKETLYKNYGVSITFHSKIIKDKIKKTNLENFGYENSLQNPEIRKKSLISYKNRSIEEKAESRKKFQQTVFRNHYTELLTHKKFSNVIPMFTVEEYKGNISSETLYKFQCKQCKTEFDSTLRGGNIPICRKCFPLTTGTSESQKEIAEFVSTIVGPDKIIENDRLVLGNGKHIDIYIPSLNIAIEYNGLYWHSEKSGKKYKNYHINKTELCASKQIKLIHIYSDEWKDKQNIIKNKLKWMLKDKSSNIIISARKCEIKPILSKECGDFLRTNHIQGDDKSSIKLGAFYNNELIAVMTFGKLRIALGNKNTQESEYEMYRNCVKNQYQVTGISNRLIKYFIKLYNPTKIFSYADRRWTTVDNIYEKLGFSLINSGTPNYWYLSPQYNNRIHRFNFVKHKLKNILPIFDPNLTEWENMQLNGYDRIWDCGSFKYELCISKH